MISVPSEGGFSPGSSGLGESGETAGFCFGARRFLGSSVVEDASPEGSGCSGLSKAVLASEASGRTGFEVITVA